jgi:N-acyl-D-aspartate/D-glutamate deacylase
VRLVPDRGVDRGEGSGTMLDLIVKGGAVVDGTGAAARRADVGVRDGRIVAVGDVDEPARRTIDADGMVVAPGFIDPHTHYDAQVSWDPMLTPSSLHGVTTMLAGNCGFTIAPMEPEHADYVRRMLSVVEGMSLAALETGPSWAWRTFGEWIDGVEAGRPAVNVGFGVGHSTLRRLAMGEAAGEAGATEAQMRHMEQMVHEAMDAGAFAFTTSISSVHHDGAGDPVPSFHASDEELQRLAAAAGQHPGTNLGIAPPLGVWDEAITARLTDLSLAADRPLYWNALIVDAHNPAQTGTQVAAGDHARQRGAAVIAETVPDLMSMRLSFETAFVLDAIPGWRPVLTLPHDQKVAALADPAVRAQLRHDLDTMPVSSLQRLMVLDQIRIGETTTPDTARFADRLLGDVARELGADPFDVMLDIVVANDLKAPIWPRAVGDDDETWALRADLWRDPRVIFGGGDGGAHLDLASTYHYFTALLGPHVRDKHLLTLEEAVHLLTQEPAFAFGLVGRGVVAPGNWADLVVFDPATIGPGQLGMRADLPAGAERLYSAATGIAAVVVNGSVVVDDGVATDQRPGAVLRSGRDTTTVTCADYWRGADARAARRP